MKKISLKLLNYKGVINIGFTKDPIVEKVEAGKINLYFVVQGARTLSVKNLVFKSPVIVNEGDPFPIIFNRLLRPLPDFEKYLVNRHGSTGSTQLKIETPATALFDAEFNDRDGADFYNRELKPGMLEDLKEDNKLAGFRCNSSNVNLFF